MRQLFNRGDLIGLTIALFAGLTIVTFENCGSSGGGGGGGTQTSGFTGTFVDDAVVGLNYQTSSGLSGVTDSYGHFQFNTGDTVTFSALGVTLGSTSPTVTTNGAAIVTPLGLVPGANDVTNTQVTNIAQFLSTLNAVSVSAGTGSSGVFVIPSNTTLQSQLQSLHVSTSDISQLQTALNNSGLNSVTVTTAANADSSLQAGLNSMGLIDTVWLVTCTGCTGGTQAIIDFRPDDTIIGIADKTVLSGTWTGSTSAGGSVAISVTTTDGSHCQTTYTSSGGIATTTLLDSTNQDQGSLSFAEVAAPNTSTNTTYLGSWYVTYTPNSLGTSQGDNGGGALVIMAPSGTFYGETNSAQYFTGSFSTSSGVGSASFTDNSGSTSQTNTLNFNLSTKSGTNTRNGSVVGTLSFSRTGSITITKNNNNGGGTGPSPTP